MPDSHKNFALSAVATAPSPATSGTSLVVTLGEGALFPTPPFNATVWPAGTNPISTNAEIVRVTAISTDTLTIIRTQEGTAARTIVVGDQIAATLTAKSLMDAENGKSFPGIGVTQVDANGYLLTNPTAATIGNQQMSPPLVWEGQGWGTTGGTSQSVRYRASVLPVQGATPTAKLVFEYSLNGGSSYSTAMSINGSQTVFTSVFSTLLSGTTVACSFMSVGQVFAAGQGSFGNSGNPFTTVPPYRTTNGGGDITPFLISGNSSDTTAGILAQAFDINGLSFTAGNGSNHVARAGINITNLINTAGSESADLIFKTQAAGAAMAERWRISSTGSLTNNLTAGTSIFELHKDVNSVTQSDANGFLLSNATNATVGLQSISAPLILQAQGWATTPAASQDVRFRIDLLPVQSAANPTSVLQFSSSINAAAYALKASLTSGGNFLTVGYISAGSNLICTTGQIANCVTPSAIVFRTTNAGGDITPKAFFGLPSTNTAGTFGFAFDTTQGFALTQANGTRHIASAAIILTGLTSTAGSEAASLSLQTQAAGAALTTKLTISPTGVITTLLGQLISSWQSITATTKTMVAGEGYVSTSTANAQIVYTLPTTVAVGAVFAVVGGSGTGGWKINQNASQVIKSNASTTTTGTGGSIAASTQFCTIELVCIIANTTFVVRSSVGTLTIV